MVNRDHSVKRIMILWVIIDCILLTFELSELLAKTSEDIEKLRKQQLDSSHNVSEIIVVLGRLNVSFQDWVETQRRQLDDIRESLQGI